MAEKVSKPSDHLVIFWLRSGYTATDIASRLKVTRQRAYQLIQRAKEKYYAKNIEMSKMR